ncbi:MAG TPA: siderophore-interacting protein [Fibrobacteria bacterium]|nr:siderophore-interacting protein [Fibrobacteria bacterium]
MRLKQRLLGVVGNRLFAKGEILAVSDPAPRFRLIEIRSPAFWDREWVPGAKIQINVGAWNVRTYTPVSLDPKWGTLKILAYRHASAPETEASQAIEAPGSRWAAQLFPGDTCRFIGPRASLRVPETASPLIVYGDETVIPTAASYRFQNSGGADTVHAVFAVDDPAQGPAVAEAVGLANARFFSKAGAAADARAALAALGREHPDAPIILAGHAQSIRTARVYLRDQGVPMSRLKIKVYWADGRTGLD